MNCLFAKLTKVEIANCVLPFIPKNKRGFSSRFDMCDIFKCIVHKLKTGCQWDCLFINIKSKASFFLANDLIFIGNGVVKTYLNRCLIRIWKSNKISWTQRN